MQELKHNNTQIDYSGVISDLEKQFELKLKGVPVEVIEHVDQVAIELKIEDQYLMLTLPQARDLKNVINKAINSVSRAKRKRQAP